MLAAKARPFSTTDLGAGMGMVGLSDSGPSEASVTVGCRGEGITRPRAMAPSGRKVKSGGRNF